MKIITIPRRYERARPPDARDSNKVPSPKQRSRSRTWKECGYILIVKIARHFARHSRKYDEPFIWTAILKPHKSHSWHCVRLLFPVVRLLHSRDTGPPHFAEIVLVWGVWLSPTESALQKWASNFSMLITDTKYLTSWIRNI